MRVEGSARETIAKAWCGLASCSEAIPERFQPHVGTAKDSPAETVSFGCTSARHSTLRSTYIYTSAFHIVQPVPTCFAVLCRTDRDPLDDI